MLLLTGLADLAVDEDESIERTAEIQLQQLNLRLSYHDWLMFKVILDSFPKQARDAMYAREQGQEVSTDPSRLCP